MIVCFCISIAAIIVGYFLWTVLIPIQDFHLMEPKKILRAQKELAVYYSLGRFLLYVGSLAFFLLLFTLR